LPVLSVIESLRRRKLDRVHGEPDRKLVNALSNA
jgi:hypothetical protein